MSSPRAQRRFELPAILRFKGRSGIAYGRDNRLKLIGFFDCLSGKNALVRGTDSQSRHNER